MEFRTKKNAGVKGDSGSTPNSLSAQAGKFKILNSSRGGYIALISALIICAVIVIIVVTLSQASFLGRANIAGSHYKERSRSLAQACANTALLKLASSSYAGNETIGVASRTCQIFAIVASSTGRIIDTQGVFEHSYTNYRVIVGTGTVDIISWEELKSF